MPFIWLYWSVTIYHHLESKLAFFGETQTIHYLFCGEKDTSFQQKYNKFFWIWDLEQSWHFSQFYELLIVFQQYWTLGGHYWDWELVITTTAWNLDFLVSFYQFSSLVYPLGTDLTSVGSIVVSGHIFEVDCWFVFIEFWAQVPHSYSNSDYPS